MPENFWFISEEKQSKCKNTLHYKTINLKATTRLITDFSRIESTIQDSETFPE